MNEDESDSELHVAVRYGELDNCLDALLEGCDPNKIGLYQWTPLHEAVSEGSSEVVKLLISHGARPEIPDKLLGDSALHHAVKSDHPNILKQLLEAITEDGQHRRFREAISLVNSEGDTVLSIASAACKKVLEKFRVEVLMKLSLAAARDEVVGHTSCARNQFSELTGSVRERPSPDSGLGSLIIRESKPREKAWTTDNNSSHQLTGSLGRLELSFEHNSKRSYLKIRLWKLVGLLLAPAFSSSIKSFYVKSYFKPDECRISKRRSDEVKVAPLLEAILSKPPQQPYVTNTGKEELFHPVEVKFSQPLVYNSVDSDTVSYKTLLIQVCARQKYTMKSFVVSDMTIPLRTAVSKIVRESFPLSPNKEVKLPAHMTILANDTPAGKIAGSDPNLKNHRSGSNLSIPPSKRPASDVNLRADSPTLASTGSDSPQVSIDMGSDIEETNVAAESRQQLSNPTNQSHRHKEKVSKQMKDRNNENQKVVGCIELHELPECQVIVHSKSTDGEKDVNRLGKQAYGQSAAKLSMPLPGNITDEVEEFELKCLSPSILLHHSIDIETLEKSKSGADVILTMPHDPVALHTASRAEKFLNRFKGNQLTKNDTTVEQLVQNDSNEIPPGSVILSIPVQSAELPRLPTDHRKTEDSNRVKILLGDLELVDMEEFQLEGSRTHSRSQTFEVE